MRLPDPFGHRLMETDTGRLALCDRELHCGDPLELLIAGHWIPVRVEWFDRWGWYAACCQRPGDGDALLIRHEVQEKLVTALEQRRQETLVLTPAKRTVGDFLERLSAATSCPPSVRSP